MKKRFNYQTGESERRHDLWRKAKPPGWRKSKSGKWYNESRKNRRQNMELGIY